MQSTISSCLVDTSVLWTGVDCTQNSFLLDSGGVERGGDGNLSL